MSLRLPTPKAPCPWCGKRKIERSFLDQYATIKCTSCEVEVYFPVKDDEKAWDKRAKVKGEP